VRDSDPKPALIDEMGRLQQELEAAESEWLLASEERDSMAALIRK
jgi:hypothetical protein